MNLIKSTAWYTAGNLFSRFLGFLLLPFYSHLIPVEHFAVYALIMSAYAVLAAVYQGGILSGFTKYFLEARDEYDRRKIFHSIFLIISSSAVLFSLIITVLAKDFSFLITGSSAYSSLIIIAGWMLFFDTLFLTILHLLKTLEIPRKVVIVTAFSAVINLLMNIYFVYLLNLNIKGILLAQLISGIFALIILLPVLKDYFGAPFDKEIVKIIFLFSVPLLAGGILSTLVDVADRFILDSLMNKEAVGIYSFAYRIGIVMNIFVISYRTAWTPLSIRLYNKSNNYSAYFGKSFNKLIGVISLIILAVSLLIDDLFHINFAGLTLFNSQYEPGLYLIPFILAGYGFSGIISFYSVYPYVSGKSVHFLITDGIAFIVNITLNLILIPVWGITGAAAATTLSFFSGAVYLRLISGVIKVDYEYKDMFLILFGGLLLFCAGFFLDLLAIDIMLILLYLFLLAAVLKFKPRTFWNA